MGGLLEAVFNSTAIFTVCVRPISISGQRILSSTTPLLQAFSTLSSYFRHYFSSGHIAKNLLHSPILIGLSDFHLLYNLSKKISFPRFARSLRPKSSALTSSPLTSTIRDLFTDALAFNHPTIVSTPSCQKGYSSMRGRSGARML